MKKHIIAASGIALLVPLSLAFMSTVEISLASAQVDASSSLPPTTDTTTVPQVTGAAISTTPSGDDASSTPETPPASGTSGAPMVATSTPDTGAPTTEQPPTGLTEVRIIGTKYTDYFTDGATVTAYPGDPKIDGNLNEPNAPIPTHEGLKWDHTDGTYLYDTQSGDLETGDYAVQSDGSYIEKAVPFVSSTSTPSTATSDTEALPAAVTDAQASTTHTLIEASTTTEEEASSTLGATGN
jgi:hypothetical protein